MTAADLARAMGVDPGRVSRLINGKISVTAESAVLLAEALGPSADFWLQLQSEWDLRVAREERALQRQEQRQRLLAEELSQERIHERLETMTLDPDEFEAIALDLMMDHFPGVHPVLPGRGVADGGVDGAVPAVEGQPRIAVHVTTGNVPRNFKRGLESQRESGASYRAHIVVTSGRLRPSHHQRLKDYAREFGVELVAIYDRHWLVPQLFRRPDLAERLLGIRGTPMALLPGPYFQADKYGEIELVGRSDELDALAVAGPRVIVAGLSGVGKSRLVRSQDDNVRFLRTDSTVDQISDDLARLDVSTVVVDDAHDDLRGLGRLVEAARQVKPGLRIVAVTWPTRLDQVRGVLPDAEVVQVSPLPRDLVATILEARGITSPQALDMLTRQAQGRVAWAHHLADLMQGEEADLSAALFGEALMRNVERLIRAASPDPATWDIFSAICAINGLSDPDAHRRLADALGVSASAVRDAVRTGTALGLIEHDGSGHRVPLEPLVMAAGSASLFGPLPVTDAEQLIDAFPSSTIDILRCVAWAAATQPPAASTLTDNLPRLFAADRLNTDEGRHTLILAAVHVPDLLSRVVEELERRAGQAETDGCPRWIVSTLDGILQNSHSRHAAAALVRLGLGDLRPWHSTTTHPHRKLEDAARRLTPEAGHDLELRRVVFDAALQIMDELPGQGAERVAMAALEPETRGSWTSPTEFRSVMISRGLVSASAIQQFEEVWWPELEKRWDISHLPATRELLGNLRSPDATEDHEAALLNLRSRISRTLLERPEAVAQAAALVCGEPIPDLAADQLDPETRTLLKLSASSLRNPEDLREDVGPIAAKLLELEPSDIVQRVAGWSTLLNRAQGQDWQPSLKALVDEIHERSHQSAEIGQEAMAQGHAQLFWPSTRKYLREVGRADVVIEAIDAANAQQRGEVFQVALGVLPDDQLARLALNFRKGDERLVDLAIRRGQLPTKALQVLLTSNEPSLEGTTAIAMTPTDPHGGAIAPELSSDWERGWDHAERPAEPGHDAWATCRALEWLATHAPDIAVRVLNRWIAEAPPSDPWPLPHGESSFLQRLPTSYKLDMLRHHRGDWWVHRKLLEGTVLSDPAFAATVLSEGCAEVDDLLIVLRGDLGEDDFRTLAETLVVAGADPAHVASGLQMGSFVGEESTRMTKLADKCARWAAETGPIAEVGRAGEPSYRRRATEALQREQRERL